MKNIHQDLIDHVGIAEALHRIRQTHDLTISAIDLTDAVIEDQDINHLDLSGVNAARSTWRRITIKRLTGKDVILTPLVCWEEVRVESGYLELVKGNGIKLSNCCFKNFSLELSEMPRSFWTNVRWLVCKLLSLNLVNGVWKHCHFTDTTLHRIDGRYLRFQPDAIGIGCTFSGKTTWTDSDLRRAKFRIACLERIEIQKIILSRPTLKDDARFEYSQIIGATTSRSSKPLKHRLRHRRH